LCDDRAAGKQRQQENDKSNERQTLFGARDS
jgi:hypothetical protein